MAHDIKIGAVIAAAGIGKRMGGVPKALIPFGNGTLLSRAIETVSSVRGVGAIIVACPPGMLEQFKAAAGSCRTDGMALQPPRGSTLLPSAAAVPTREGVFFVEGGAERFDSVEAAFRAIPASADEVLIHDVARPFATAALCERIVEAAAKTGAAVPVVPPVDTVKRVEAGTVVATLDRSVLGLTQTPQCFHAALYRAALDAWNRDGRPPVTDDAALVERLGIAVAAVEGERGNVKITWPGDLPSIGAAGDTRVGTGWDVHRTAPGRRLVLGGVEFQSDFGLVGHSDADVVAHAVCDAILGAAAMGDIGRRFPDSDPEWKDADSIALLSAVAAEVRAAGFGIANIDCTVIAERPKIAPFAGEMAARIARAAGIETSRVGIKGKTAEGLGAEGRCEAISAQAAVLLIFRSSSSRASS